MTDPRATLPETLAKIPPGNQPVLIVVEQGTVLGVISTAELLAATDLADGQEIIVAADIMNTSTPLLRTDDDLYTALERFRQAGIDVLPVVARDGRRLVGVLERTAMLREMREHMANRSAAALREHAAFSTLANDIRLDDLLALLSEKSADTVVRMRVPSEALGLSLREADFRRRFGVYVIGIETSDGRLMAPPDPQRPLGQEDVLIVMQTRHRSDAPC